VLPDAISIINLGILAENLSRCKEGMAQVYRPDAMKIDIKNNYLIINDKTIVFKHEIVKYLTIDNIIIVLIKGIENENIYGVDKSGIIIWQIEKYDFFHGQSNCIYTEIVINDNKLISYNFCGFFCTIDYKTGKVLSV
jgi:hypothetical protein